MAQDMETYLSEGARGEYRAAHMEMMARDEGRRMEQEGLVWGLERALQIIEMAEGEQAPPPQPRPHSGQPAPGEKKPERPKYQRGQEAPRRR